MPNTTISTHSRRINALIVILLLIGSQLTAPTPAVASVPNAYIGVWHGEDAVQINPSLTFTVDFGIGNGDIGQVIGSVAYPSLFCGGEIRLKSIHAHYIELTATITYGSCFEDGSITLSPIGTTTLSYQWRSSSTQATASGTITRVNTAGTAIPNAYIGVWRGQGSGRGGSYSILLTLVPSGNGSVAGIIAYPSLRCGGIVTLQTADTTSLSLPEDLTYDIGLCVHNGVNTLLLQSPGTLGYEWRVRERLDVGSLTRVSGPHLFLPLIRR